MGRKAIETFKKAAELNRNQEQRVGNILHLPADGKLIIAGDLHGNRSGFMQILRYAKLAKNPNTHILFQEIIHGGTQDRQGGCLSFKLLLKAARLKIKHPDNVHFVMGNHDASTISGTEVLRGGKEMNGAFCGAIERCYGEDSEMVMLSLRQFLFSQALAAKTQTGIMISHSLPSDRCEDDFDDEVLNRNLWITDIARNNSAYIFLWGRDQSGGLLERLAKRLGAELFIVGHQRQEEGSKKVEPNMLILASDHSNGSVAILDLAKRYDLDSASRQVRKLIDLG